MCPGHGLLACESAPPPEVQDSCMTTEGFPLVVVRTTADLVAPHADTCPDTLCMPFIQYCSSHQSSFRTVSLLSKCSYIFSDSTALQLPCRPPSKAVVLNELQMLCCWAVGLEFTVGPTTGNNTLNRCAAATLSHGMQACNTTSRWHLSQPDSSTRLAPA